MYFRTIPYNAYLCSKNLSSNIRSFWVYTPDNATAVAAALGETGPVTEVKVTADPALGPGEAQIGWSQGGAEIDVEAITEAALDRFRLQLDGYLQQGA